MSDCKAPEKIPEAFPDLQAWLRKCFANMINIDHQIVRLEQAEGRHRTVEKGDDELVPPVIINVEQMTAELVTRLDIVEKNLRFMVDRLLGSE